MDIVAAHENMRQVLREREREREKDEAVGNQDKRQVLSTDAATTYIQLTDMQKHGLPETH
jgi:hypothetical protein